MILNESRPIFAQIMAWVEDNILRGEWAEGFQLPSVREMSARFKVNNNTVVRTYEHLALSDTIYSQRGIGYFVAPGAFEAIMKRRQQEFYFETLPHFINQVRVLNIDPDEIALAIKKALQ